MKRDFLHNKSILAIDVGNTNVLFAIISASGIGKTFRLSTVLERTSDEYTKRRERDELLKNTDHYALTDRTLSEEMASYRQSLRDFPEQSGFPYIDFPEQPDE